MFTDAAGTAFLHPSQAPRPRVDHQLARGIKAVMDDLRHRRTDADAARAAFRALRAEHGDRAFETAKFAAIAASNR